MPLEMNPEIRAAWCAALRSGEYQQVTGTLRDTSPTGAGYYCCLGVLTDLYVKAGQPESYQPGPSASASVWDSDVLTTPVRDWAGLGLRNPVLEPAAARRRAAELNDDGVSFARIADLIDGGVSQP